MAESGLYAIRTKTDQELRLLYRLMLGHDLRSFLGARLIPQSGALTRLGTTKDADFGKDLLASSARRAQDAGLGVESDEGHLPRST